MRKIISAVLVLSMLITLAACGESDKDFNYKNNYTDVETVSINKEGLTWPVGQALPSFAPIAEHLDAININNKSNADKAMMSALAGIINKKQPRLLLYTSQGVTEKWHDIANLNFTVTKEITEIVSKYKDEITGLIVWDTKVPDTINLATTMAGLKNAMIVNEKQLETLSEFSFEIIQDFRGMFNDKLEVYNYLYDNLWKDCEKRLVTGIKPDGWELRDLTTATGCAILWLESTTSQEADILRKFFAECKPAETYYAGWWDSEGDGVSLGSEYGIPTIPSDYYYNYSIYAGTSRELDVPTVPKKPELENKFYVSFTLSDGDNLQYVQHAMKSAGQLWPAKNRGKYPINWTCSPALLDAGPQLLNHYYQTATENDVLICGPSGLGYTYPTDWNKNAEIKDLLSKYAQNTDSYFRRTAFNMITVWNFITDDQASIYAQNIRSLVGFTAQERFPRQEGQYIVDGLVPLITTHPRYDGDTDRVLSIVDEQIANWDGNSPAFIIPQLVAWESAGGVFAVVKIAEALQKKYGEKVEFVRGDHLMMLYNEANKTPYNVSLQAQNVTASGSDENHPVSQVVDGSFAKNKGWQSSGDGEKWFVIDLEQEYTLSRYVLKNAACGYYSKELNTAGFKVQSSMDGNEWVNIDIVKDNKSNIVDKDVDKFDARYVRLLITDPGADGVARVQDFELYGVRK